MNFIEELKWRGMLFDATPGVEEHLQSAPRTGYIGFDPTAPSLTIGNYVQIMILTIFQQCGHHPIVLMGGATGKIGDPSFKDKERELKGDAELENNLAHQILQFRKLMRFEDVDNPARIVDNYDFYKNMNALTFLRDVGKSLTVNYMMSKESVKKRIETGISFTEFSYQLLQAYDYQCLYEQSGVTVQMGGSDQWGNITSGTEMIRRNIAGKAFAVTTPLLTKSDGSKFGKSESGNIWLDPKLTSPYQFYQFWINADDRDIHKYIRYFTFKTREEVEAAEAQYADQPQVLKQMLAEELTARIHSPEALVSVQAVTDMLFNPKADAEQLQALSEDNLEIIQGEIPSFRVSRHLLAEPLGLIDLMAEHTSMLASKGEARRAIQGNAISLNKRRISDLAQTVGKEDLLHDRFLMLENGKKNKFLVEFTD